MNFHKAGFLASRVPFVIIALTIAGVGFLRLDTSLASKSGNALRHGLQPTLKANHGADLYGQLPLSFEANEGQSLPQVKFLARGVGYGLYLTSNDAFLTLQGSQAKSISAVRMSLENANPRAAIEGSAELPGKSNYFIGNDPAQWRRNIPQFARVRYHAVYPGIDLVYYGKQGKLEYDFEVAPGSDPGQIALNFAGPKTLELAANGDLNLILDNGEAQLHAPRIYQKTGTGVRSVKGKFVRSSRQVSFEIGEYDRNRTLIIDPVLTYSTYLGGSGSESCSAIEQTQLGISTALFTPGCPAITVDSAFRTYVAGATTSPNFPGVTTAGTVPTSPPTASYQECLDTPPPNPSTCTAGLTNSDVFVARLNASGTALDYSTYLGGTGSDVPAGIAVDQNFNVHIAGTTNSSNFPTAGTSAFAFQSTPVSSGLHVFVSEVAASGAALFYSTYLSGHGTDIASGIAVDNLGKEYIIGTTTSPSFPTSGGFPTTPTGLQTAPKATNQFFFTKLDPTISGPGALLYSTYIGGSTPANGITLGGGIAVDTTCDAYLTGGTNFTDMPALNANQGTNAGGIDAWVAKFSPPTGSACGSQLSETYMTYFGGSGNDIGYGIAVDTSLDAYITGSTTSPDIAPPTTSGAPVPVAKCIDTPPPLNTTYPATCPTVSPSAQCGNAICSDAFVAKFGSLTSATATGTNVPYEYFTYLGGSGADAGTSIAIDNIGGAVITGLTNSTNFPLLPIGFVPVQGTFGGGAEDAFLARIDTTTVCTPNPGASPPLTCPGFSSYLGGSGTDIGTGVAIDSVNSSYVTGETSSPNFPLSIAPAVPFQAALSGPSDAFVTKVSTVGSLAVTPTTPCTTSVTPCVVGVGNSVAFTYTIINNGDPTNDVVLTDNLPTTGATLTSISSSPGTCAAAVSSTVSCSIGALNTGAIATVTVNLTPTAPSVPLTAPGQLSNSVSVSAPGAQVTSASSTATIDDFNIETQPGTPSSITVPAGVPASFTFEVLGTFGSFPDSISLSVAAGLPTSSTQTWTTNPIPNLNGGAQSTVLTISTTARVTTTTKLWREMRQLYALGMPICGIAFLGLGTGGRRSRKKRIISGIAIAGFFALILLQPACSSSSSTTTTTGTPAGTYTLTVDATSGSATRTTTVTLIVQ